MRRKWITELLAILLIGDGVLSFVYPRRYLLAVEFGPEGYKRALEELAERPPLTRLLAVGQVGLALFIASRGFSRGGGGVVVVSALVYGRPRAAQNEEGRGYSKEESRPSSTLLTSERFPARRKVNRLPAVHRGGVAPPTDGADGFARGDPSAALGMAEGEDPGPAHPVVEALRGTTDAELRRPMSEHGTVLGAWLGDDEIIRGERERPGPLVREASPGVYKGEEDIVRPVRDA